MSVKTGAVAVVAGWLAAAVGAGSAAAAENSWPKFPGSAYGSQDDASDRDFIKEWEATPPKGYPTLSPTNLAATKAAIKRYTEIVAAGGWQPLPEVQLQSGMSHPAVALLRERLLLSGDLKEGGSVAELRLLRRKGGEALSGLQRPGADGHRRQAHDCGAERAGGLAAQAAQDQPDAPDRAAAKSAGKKYIVVNIPAAQIEIGEGDRIVSRHAGVVGKPDRPTPILNSAIHELNFNAVWHLPPTVIEKDLIPKGQDMARRGQSVLVKYHIDAYGGDGKKLDPAKVNWSARHRQGLDLPAAAGAGQPAGLRQDQLQQHAFRLHARHALPVDVRAQFPRGQLRLRARARHRAAGRLGAGRPGLEARARGGDEDVAASGSTSS